MEALRVKAGHEERLKNGWRMVVEPLNKVRINPHPSEVSLHEARHAYAAMLLGIGVHYMTNVAEGNSLGHTLLSQFNPVVAAAPDALGSPGGGHDLWQIFWSGHSIESARSQARALLADHEKEILALATRLDEIRKMGGQEMFALAREVDKEKREGPLMLVRLIAPDGTEKKIEKRARGNVVELSAADLPKDSEDEAQKEKDVVQVPIELPKAA